MAKAVKMEKYQARKPKQALNPARKMVSTKTMMSKVHKTVQESSSRLLPPTFSDTIELGGYGGSTMKVMPRE
jgi:hypothetical protein